MTLDDRLRTTLAADTAGGTGAQSQYRQIVDLLGSGQAIADGSLFAAAFMRLAALSRRISAPHRAEILSEPSLRLRSASLVARLCEEEALAPAALAAAELDTAGWAAVQAVLGADLQARARTLRMERAAVQRRAGAPGPAVPDLAALAQRIERFRERGQADAQQCTPLPPLPANDILPAQEIDIALDPAGRIVWAGDHAPMVCGLTLLSAPEAVAQIDGRFARALRRRQTVRDCTVTIAAAPAVSGQWRLDAVPHFDEFGGFLRHHARLTRMARGGAGAASAGDPRGDGVRQALHELRTPLNALQGFSEIVQQQIFGPVPHQYRASAAAIAADSARMLAALEEVERLVLMRGGRAALSEGETALAAVTARLIEQVEPQMAARGAGFAVMGIDPAAAVPMQESDAERMVWRLLAVMAGAAGEGERLALHLAAMADGVRLSIALPMALVSCSDAELFEASAHERTCAGDRSALGLMGAGFALRLVAAEAKAAGGRLLRQGGRLLLTLPAAGAFRDGRQTAC